MSWKALAGFAVATGILVTPMSASVAATTAAITTSPASSPAAPIVVAAGDAVGRAITFGNGDKSASTSALVVALSGTGFSKVSDTCSGKALAPKKSCTVRVAFAGTAPATVRNATLTLGAKNKTALATSFLTVRPALPPPSVTIAVDAGPEDAQDFHFTTTGTGPAGWTDGIDLDDDSTSALPSSSVFTLPPGAKSITASAVVGWSLMDLTCAGVPVGYPDGMRTATFTLVPGDSVFCTYSYRKDATISIRKSASPSDGTDFGFSGDLGTFTLDDGGPPDAVSSSETFVVLAPEAGTKTITETAMAGWTTTGIDCVGTSSFTPDLENRSVNVLVDSGDTVTCTFTNQGPP